jgi:hypothetical protein
VTADSTAVVVFRDKSGDEIVRINTSLKQAQTLAAIFSLEKARAGDMSQIAERLRLGTASDRERRFVADYLEGKVKTRKRRRGSLSAIERAMLREFVVWLEAKNWSKEAIVQEACERFQIKRSYVFELLKDKVLLAQIKEQFAARERTQRERVRAGVPEI